MLLPTKPSIVPVTNIHRPQTSEGHAFTRAIIQPRQRRFRSAEGSLLHLPSSSPRRKPPPHPPSPTTHTNSQFGDPPETSPPPLYNPTHGNPFITAVTDHLASSNSAPTPPASSKPSSTTAPRTPRLRRHARPHPPRPYPTPSKATSRTEAGFSRRLYHHQNPIRLTSPHRRTVPCSSASNPHSPKKVRSMIRLSPLL